MIFKEGNRELCLVYNGELYNTEELRQSLLLKGCRFAGLSDTEVLLKAYAEWGEDCVNMLNGIFAFAVWDERERKLFAARDRIGVKPFFYALSGGSFCSPRSSRRCCCIPASGRKSTPARWRS
jgi:asparagine synthase (glutamine-hydrolysing)